MSIPEREYSRGYHERKQHGEQGFPFNIYPCTIPGDFLQMPVHWHEEMEVIAVKKGSGMVTVDRETYPVQAGGLVVVFPGQLHGIGPGEMEYENIIFQPSMLMTGGNDSCTLRYLRPVAEQALARPLLVEEGSQSWEEFREWVSRLDRVSDRREEGWQLAIKGLLFYLLALIARREDFQPEARPGKSRERIKSLLAYLEEHYGEEVSVEQAAALCYYSKSHFMKYFKQYMGIPFTSYVNDLRLARAAEQLLATEDKVTEVARRCGFGNISYFNRQFHRKYSMTPRQFRG